MQCFVGITFGSSPYILIAPAIEQWPMSSERDSFAKGIFSTFAKGFLLHKLLLKVNFSPLRVKKSRSHDMGQCDEPDGK
jgi:hypothetical protein